MEKLTKKEGIKMLPLIWTIFLSQSEDLWAEPFSNRKMRYRCIFEKTNGIAEELKVYFHLSEKELVSNMPESIYFYGAFNQINVHQVRSFGNVREMTDEEKENFIKLIKVRLTGKAIGDRLPAPMSFKESQEIPLLIQSGKFYFFEPLEYAYHVYERG